MNYQYIIITLFIVAAIIYYAPKIVRLFYAFTDKMIIDKKSTLNPKQLRQVLIGAPYGMQQIACLNNLKPKLPLGRRTTILQEYWDIYTPADAKNTIDYMVKYGFRYHFEKAVALYKSPNEEEQQLIVDSLEHLETADAFERVNTMYINLRDSLDEMVKIKLVNSLEDLERLGVTGWDAGRISFMTRLCYEAKLLTEDEAWEYLEQAEEIAQQDLDNWHDCFYSYVAGRYLWGGKDDGFGDIFLDYAKKLLNDPQSPVKDVPFK